MKQNAVKAKIERDCRERGGKMGKIFAVANQKGGVGKSTVVVNLAAALGMLEQRVLCVDVDPQGNTTSGLGVKKKALKCSTYDVLIGQAEATDAIMKTDFRGISLVPADMRVAGCEIELAEIENRLTRLKMQLLTVKLDFDYILIDCPPSLSLLTLNGLCAADRVIVPMQCEFYSLEGLTQLVETIKLVRARYNPTLEIEGILFNMHDPRLNVAESVVKEVKNHFPDNTFNTTIPRNVRISEAPSFGKPIGYYDKVSKGAQAFHSLALELMGVDKAPEPKKRKLFGKK
jgi:chromosome partitioning protein